MDLENLIHPDIAKAETLPASIYTDPRYFALQRDTVFANSWHLCGDKDLVKTPGDVHPFKLVEGMLEEPLVLTRDDADTINCLSNVCTHRGNLVEEFPGNKKSLMCRYHGRKWKLDGSFSSMPEFDGVENFPADRDNLQHVPHEQWGRWLFANLNPSYNAQQWLAPVQELCGWLPFNEFRYSEDHSRDYLVKANWALYCDNYLEGFHIPFVHPGLNQVLDYRHYRTELFDHCSLQVGIAKGTELAFDLPKDHRDADQRVGGYYFLMFPNLMLNFYPWGLSINVVKPLAVDYTRVSFITYIWNEALMDKGAGAGLDVVEREDEEVVECVQKGVRSRIYNRGRYSVKREQCVHHFHRLLTSAMAKG